MTEKNSTKKRFHRRPKNCRWRKVIATILTLFIFQVHYAQLSNYEFSTSMGGVLNSMEGSTDLIVASSDDGSSSLTNIGFDFLFNGIYYTSFSANVNGFIRLGATPGSNSWTNSQSNINLQSPILMAYWDDLHTGSVAGGGKVHYKVIGDAPNRILIVEWFVTVPRVTAGTPNAKIQAWLYETSNKIKYVYGGVGVNSSSSGYSIGVGASSINFLSVNSVTDDLSTSAFITNNIAGITDGKVYEFTPPPCSAVGSLNATDLTHTSATLSWMGHSNSVAYDIELMTEDQAPTEGVLITNHTANSLVLNDLNTASLYKYRVRNICSGGDGVSSWSQVYSFLTACSIPDAPSNIAFNNVSSTSTGIQWEGTTNIDGGYVVFRSTSSTPPVLSNGANYTVSTFSPVASLSNETDTYYCIYNGVNSAINASGLTANTDYYFYVFSRNGGASSSCLGAITYSSSALVGSQTTLPQIPTSFSSSDLGFNNATISWNFNAGGEAYPTSFSIEVYTDTDYSNPISGSPFTTTTPSLSLSNLNESTTYYVRIKSVTDAGESGYLTGSFTTLTPGQIGSGNSTATNLPINAYYGYTYSQQIYLASEIESAIGSEHRLITKIRFKNVVAHTPYTAYNQWEIYLANTNKATFSANYEWLPSSDFVKVFDGTVNIVENAWIEIEFLEPFLWDGVSNIALAVVEKTPNYVVNGTSWAVYSTTTNRSMTTYRDSGVILHDNLPVSGTSIQRNLVVNQIQLVSMMPSDCMYPTGLAVEDIEANSFRVNWNAIDDVDNYMVYLFNENDDPEIATPILSEAASENTILLTVEPETTYDVYVKSVCGSGMSEFSSKLTVTTLELCLTPEELKLESYTSTSVNITWDSSASSFQIQYGLEGFELGSGTTLTSDTNSINISDLITDQTYDVYVKAICSDVDAESNWTEKISVTPSHTLVYAGGNINTQYVNTIVTINNNSGCPGIMTLMVPEGKQIASLTVEYSMSTASNAWMNEQRSYIKSPSLGIGENAVVSGEGNTNGTYNYSRELDFAVGAMGEVVFELHAFRTYGNSPTCGDNYNYVVDGTWKLIPTFEDAPSCPTPMNLIATSVIIDAVALEWNSTGAEFEVEYGPTGFEHGSGIIISGITSNSITIDGLTLEQTYDFYVRNVCDDEVSAWSNVVSETPTATLTYLGEISSLYNSSPTINSVSTCPGTLTMIVPEGKQIASLTAEYSITSLSAAYLAEQRSYIKSPTLGMGEEQLFFGVGNSTGTYNYSRELDFAVGATGEIVFEIHVFRVWGGSGCNTNYAYIPSGTWKLTPVFEDIPSCPKPTSLFASTGLDTANIEWTSTGTEFEVEYGPTGFELGTGITISGITTNSITLENLIIDQTYDFYVKSICSEDDESIWSSAVSFRPGYCIPSVSDCTDGDLITNVTFGEINNDTACSPNGYGNYSSQIAFVEAGEFYPISVTVGGGWSSESVAVWIDYNKNGVFEQNEYTFIGTGSNSTVTGSILIPVDVQTGEYRMRVRVVAATEATIGWETACNINNLYGETEDYTVSVISNVITWTGTQWINGTPNPAKAALIAGDLVVGTDYPSFEVGNLFVSSEGNLTIANEQSVTANGIIYNLGNASNFTVSDGGNLFQNSNMTNIGSINVVKMSQPMLRLDYTMWSSPVASQGLRAFSPMTLWNRFYTYEETGYEQIFPSENSADQNFTLGRGYMLRSPNDWSSTVEAPYIGVFTGVPNNGLVTAAVPGDSYYSLGNPYPTNLDADLLLDTNNSINTIYFWTNTNAPQDGSYVGVPNNYAYYNATGGTNATNSSVIPNGIISVGQGFIVFNDQASIVQFDNSMRTNLDATSFRINGIEKHRFWLNLFDENEYKLNQVLVGYIDGATDGFDSKFDAELFSYEGTAIYSNIENKELIIQGKALPFQVTDVVPLGLKVVENGRFKISLFQFDGLFLEGETLILLKDKELNTVHNLMESDYEFEAIAGQYNDRFEVIYHSEGEMDVTDLANNTILIYQHNQQIVVDAKSTQLSSVELYDLQGKQIHFNSKVNASNYKIDVAGFGPQVFIVRAKTIDGYVISKKIVNK